MNSQKVKMTHSLDIPAKAGTIRYAAKKNGALPV